MSDRMEKDLGLAAMDRIGARGGGAARAGATTTNASPK